MGYARGRAALSCLVFRVGVGFSSFVLFGGSHDKHLQDLIGVGDFSSVTVNAKSQKVLPVPGQKRLCLGGGWRGAFRSVVLNRQPGLGPTRGLVPAAGLGCSWLRGPSLQTPWLAL